MSSSVAALQIETEQRLRIRRANVEVPVGVLHGHAVHPVLRTLRIVLCDGLEDRIYDGHAGDWSIDLARNEILGPERRQQFRERRVAPGHQLQDQQCGDKAVVGEAVVAEVIVAGDLTAEDGVVLSHALLEERVADAVHQAPAALGRNDIRDGVAGAHVVHDG